MIKPPKNQKEYEEEELRLKLSYAPRTYSCRKCGWPVREGFCCGYCGTDSPFEGKAKVFE